MVDKNGRLGVFRENGFLVFFGLFLVMAAAFYVYNETTLVGASLFVQAICFLLSLGWVMIFAREWILRLSSVRFTQITIHPAWLAVFAALALRYYAYSIFPPANQTGFEELETGSAAYDLLVTPDTPLSFRFTNLLGALGFITGAGMSLTSLRIPFQLMGMLGLLLLVFSLRELRVGWISTLLVVFIAATMRFLVIAAGTADELFFGIPILTAFVLFVINSENAKGHRPFWLATAGLFAGILMFEYTAYRMFVFVFGAWLIWKCVRREDASSPLFDIFSFTVPLFLMALPIFTQTVLFPGDSEFFEAFWRHGAMREGIFTQTAWVNLSHHIRGMTGLLQELNAYYAPHGEPLLFPLFGGLFTVSFFFNLFFAGRGLPRLMALSVLLTIFTASLFANNPNIGRMSPTFPLLLVMSGIFLEKVIRSVIQWAEHVEFRKQLALLLPRLTLLEQHTSTEVRLVHLDKIQSGEFDSARYVAVNLDARRITQFLIRYLFPLLFVAMLFQITWANLESLRRMSVSPQVLNEYANDDYSVCIHIGNLVKPGERVYIYSPDNFDPCSRHVAEGWYFGGNRPEIIHLFGEFPTADILVPGDLVVMGVRNRKLTAAELDRFIELADAAGALPSWQISKNIAGKTTTASFCFRCEE